MVRWVVGSILHGVDPLSYFSFQPVFHDWCNKGRGMCYPVCGMVHMKKPLLLIGKSSLSGGSEFPFSLSEWSLIICLTPYNRKIKHFLPSFMIGTRVRGRQRPPTTLSELGQALQEEWNRLPRMVIGRIIRSMPRRLNQCLTNRGGITHY